MLGLLPTQVADLCEHLITHFPVIPDTDVSVNTKVGCAAAGRSRPQACAFVFVLLGSPLPHRIASQTRLYREDYASAELRQAAARRRTSKRDESATVRGVTCERGGWDAGVVHCSADGVAPRHLLCHSRSKVLCGPLGGPRASRSRLVSGVVSVTCHLHPPPRPSFHSLPFSSLAQAATDHSAGSAGGAPCAAGRAAHAHTDPRRRGAGDWRPQRAGDGQQNLRPPCQQGGRLWRRVGRGGGEEEESGF